ncbi:MAG: hypothetical protein NT120_00810 [Candidatus Aenigmarchaeota archaeon]|nr:hypothetical protein [Candidatus Aenigmarchaeota archaeon]
MALEIEMATYNKELPRLLSQTGKHVLIIEDRVIDTYVGYDAALKRGYMEAGIGKPFLVKKIAKEDIQFFTRNITSASVVYTQ